MIFFEKGIIEKEKWKVIDLGKVPGEELTVASGLPEHLVESKLPKISQEPINHVDATPDNGYPLRILRVHRENCNCEWISNVDNPIIQQMNQDCRKRAEILDKAIKILEENAS